LLSVGRYAPEFIHIDLPLWREVDLITSGQVRCNCKKVLCTVLAILVVTIFAESFE
jgi:hypothetical protein